MRAICHILRSVGYFTLLPYLAYAADGSFTTCMPKPSAQFVGLLLTAITFLFIIGYGDVLTKKLRGSAVRFWIASTAFYAVVAGLTLSRGQDYLLARIGSSLSGFQYAFFPAYRPDSALDAVGGLTDLALAVWMPVGFVLSMVALVQTSRTSRNARVQYGEMERTNQSEASDLHKLSSADDRG